VENKVVYAVYSQFEPSYQYEPQLESLWSNEHTADIAAKALKNRGIYDFVYVTKLQLDHEELYGN
jgi:hypothetical protein